MNHGLRLVLQLAGVASSGCMTAVRTPPKPVVSSASTFNPINYPVLGIYVEDLSGRRLRAGVLREIEDEFMRGVLEGGFGLAARSDIERVLKELRMQASSVTEEEAARMGRALNVPAILLVTVNRVETGRRQRPAVYDPRASYYRSAVALSVRLVGAERAQILWVASYNDVWDFDSSSGDRTSGESEALRRASRVIATELPRRPHG